MEERIIREYIIGRVEYIYRNGKPYLKIVSDSVDGEEETLAKDLSPEDLALMKRAYDYQIV